MTRHPPLWLLAVAALAAWACPPVARFSLCPKPAAQERARQLNPHWARLDANGVPVAPRFVVQKEIERPVAGPGTGPLCLPDPEADDACGGFPNEGGVPRGKPACNDLAREEQPAADVVHGLVCNAGRLFTRFAGHLNYLPATYVGLMAYENHSRPDDDLDFEMLPLDSLGTGWQLRRTGTTSRRRVEEGLVADPELGRKLRESGLDSCLHVEAKFEESVRNFGQEWWAAFRDADKARRKEMVAFRPAVVTGLLGLDAEHGAFTELHPAYGLAIQTACARPDEPGRDTVVDTWALFVRNSGNEGWCSQWDVPHFFDAPGGVYTLAFPTALSGEMESVELLPSSEILANRSGVVRSPAVLENGQVVIRLQWPSDLGVQGELRIHGELKLRWRPKAGTVPRCVDLAQALAASVADPVSVQRKGVRERPPAREVSAEEFLAGLEIPPARVQEAKAAPDGEPVPEAPVAAPVLPPWGPCPGNEPSCLDSLKPAVRDRVAAPPQAAFKKRADFEKEICEAAEARAGRGTAGIDEARLNQLLAACRGRR